MRTTLAAVVLCLASVAHAQRADDRVEQREVAQTVAQSLRTLQELAANENFATLGFKSADEVTRAQAGAALPVYLVRLDRLREYRAGTDPEALLVKLERWLVPITVGGEVRSSVSVEKIENRWQATSFGSPALIRSVNEVAPLNDAQTSKPAPPFLVFVAALGNYYVGRRETAGLTLTTIADDPVAGTRAGVTQPAEVVFVALAQAAQSYNGLPR